MRLLQSSERAASAGVLLAAFLLLAAPAFADRTGELVNPDDSTMVFLFYDLAGKPIPFDSWVERDSRVASAAPMDKQARRQEARADLEAAAAAVKGIGRIRLSMSANLSDYDPTYGEFTIRALSPSSIVTFEHFDQKISLRFENGQKAQIWSVPQADSQAMRDKIAAYGGVSLDVMLRIGRVQPAPQGGTITMTVMSYELRASNRGVTLARVQVVPE